MSSIFKPIQHALSTASLGLIPSPEGTKPFLNILRPKESGVVKNPLGATLELGTTVAGAVAGGALGAEAGAGLGALGAGLGGAAGAASGAGTGATIGAGISQSLGVGDTDFLKGVLNQLPSPGDKVTAESLKAAEDAIRRARGGPGITTGPQGVLGAAPSFAKTLIGLTKNEIMEKLGLLGGQTAAAKLGG